MLYAALPARQQAHDLIERLTPIQLSALLDLLGALPAAASVKGGLLVSTPFSDEPEPREGFGSQDSDFWPAARPNSHAGH